MFVTWASVSLFPFNQPQYVRVKKVFDFMPGLDDKLCDILKHLKLREEPQEEDLSVDLVMQFCYWIGIVFQS